MADNPRRLTLSEYLESKGWRLIGTQRNQYGLTKYWDHSDHQPERRGAFTTVDAVAHQKQSETLQCGCIRSHDAEVGNGR